MIPLYNELISLLYIILIIFGVVLLLFIILKIVLLSTSSRIACTNDRNEDFASIGTLSFLQYNVFWRPTIIHIGRAEYVSERASLLLDQISKFDICAFNEAFQFGSSIVQEFVEGVKEKGFNWAISSEKSGFFSRFVIDSGLLLFSKHPILESQSIIYSSGCGVDNFASKGALYAKVKTGVNDHLHVFCTHLQASYGDPTGIDVSVRVSQVEELSQFMTNVSSDGYPLVLLGDFNVNSRKGREYDMILNVLNVRGYKCTNVTHQYLGSHPVTFGDSEGGKPIDTVLTTELDFNTHQCLDYIFLFQKVGVPLNIDSLTAEIEKFHVKGHPFVQLSDHYGISTAFSLSRSE